MWAVWRLAGLEDYRVHARTRRAGAFCQQLEIGCVRILGRPRVRLQRCAAIGAEEGEDMTEGGRDVEPVDLEALVMEVWAVVRLRSAQFWAASLHVHETFLAQLLLRF